MIINVAEIRMKFVIIKSTTSVCEQGPKEGMQTHENVLTFHAAAELIRFRSYPCNPRTKSSLNHIRRKNIYMCVYEARKKHIFIFSSPCWLKSIRANSRPSLFFIPWADASSGPGMQRDSPADLSSQPTEPTPRVHGSLAGIINVNFLIRIPGQCVGNVALGDVIAWYRERISSAARVQAPLFFPPEQTNKTHDGRKFYLIHANHDFSSVIFKNNSCLRKRTRNYWKLSQCLDLFAAKNVSLKKKTLELEMNVKSWKKMWNHDKRNYGKNLAASRQMLHPRKKSPWRIINSNRDEVYVRFSNKYQSHLFTKFIKIQTYRRDREIENWKQGGGLRVYYVEWNSRRTIGFLEEIPLNCLVQ